MPVEISTEHHERMAREIMGEKYHSDMAAQIVSDGWPDPTSWLFLGPLLVALVADGWEVLDGNLCNLDLSVDRRWDPIPFAPDAILAAGLAVLEAKEVAALAAALDDAVGQGFGCERGGGGGDED